MKKTTSTLLASLIAVIVLISGCSSATFGSASNGQIDPTKSLTAYYIDVGQADACLLAYNGHFMVIDGGNNADEQTMVDFLNSKGVKKLDYVIGTHPDADHIGGLDAVIENFDVQEVAMPKVSSNTRTFADVLTAVEQKGLSITAPAAGTTFSFNGIPIQVIAPVKEYDDANNNSIVLKVTYQDISALFTGDIETQAENDILKAGYDLRADILKVAHHGSDTSSTQDFIDAVNPDYAVISCGKDNKYGHPHKKALNRLQDKGIAIYRTDECGAVEITTDGHTIDIRTETAPSSKQKANSFDSAYYIGNLNSKVYHSPDCGSLPSEKNRISFDSRQNAIDAGYTACGRCVTK